MTGAFALLWWAERRRPLRRRVEHPAEHQARNASVAALAALTVQVAEMPLVLPLAGLVERRGWGLLGSMKAGWLRTILSLALLDYTLYIWHVLTHRVPALWRFHAVHHVDRDLDATTAVRFHFGELVLSIPWRATQVLAIGVSRRDLELWQRAVLLSIAFHHSNLRLPAHLERAIAVMVMTPRLHGIHHANLEAIRDSNWSSGLTVWDRLHGTLRTEPPQDAITIGVEGYEGEDRVALPHLLAMPFTDDAAPTTAVVRPRVP